MRKKWLTDDSRDGVTIWMRRNETLGVRRFTGSDYVVHHVPTETDLEDPSARHLNLSSAQRDAERRGDAEAKRATDTPRRAPRRVQPKPQPLKPRIR